MSIMTKELLPSTTADVEEAPLKVAPTLYTIILFKLLKGGLFLFLGLVLYFRAAHANLPQEWSDFSSRPWVQNLFEILRIHPENRLLQNIAEQVTDYPPQRVRLLAVGTMVWSLFPLVEGVGLIFRFWWAGWLAIAESAFFVPIEIYRLARQYSPPLLIVTIANIVIVWYLYANRQALFHHKHRAQTS
jgi:uncharacterized membrane protein (DUF2068 family)